MRQRFTFRFFHPGRYLTEEIVLVGIHYDDAKTGAWSLLAERVRDRDARASWRLVSTMQEPLLAVVA